MISFQNKGDFKDTIKFLNFSKKNHNIDAILSKYGEIGVRELTMNTPVDSGKTASMWGYEIHKSKGRYSLIWTNDNVNNGVPIAILIQYGHSTGTGGYVQGIDYINPSMKKTFSRIAEELWKEGVGK